MRRTLILFAILLSVFPAAAEEAGYPQKILLDGTWQYQPLARTTLKVDDSIVEDKANLPASGKMVIPSNWHLSGLPDFNGRVRFERDFDFRARLSPLDRAFLVFHGVDYFAEVEINGVPVGRHEGYFQTFEFDVTPQLRRGHNRVAVVVDAPFEEPGPVGPEEFLRHKRMIKGVFSDWDCKPGSISRKFGQDGTSAGIWNSVELEIRHVAWLGNVKLQSYLYERGLATGHKEEKDPDAKIFITAEVHAVNPGKYVLAAEAGGAKASTEVMLTTPATTVVLVLPIERPRLWWTWDLGEPYLYTCKLSLAAGGEVLYQRDTRFGVRSISLDEKTGEWRLNGIRFFIRGTNIVPDIWLARYTPDRIAQDVKLLREAYVNGVRVCVHVNREELYEALDRAGIVAWQDFPLQWDYTQTDDFMQEAARQLREMIRQFYNHPSIVTWVCQNESSAYNVNVLDPFLAHVGTQEDSSRPVRPVAAFNEHIYAGWYDSDYHDYMTAPRGPIISELGAQALPSLEETREMFGDTWPPDWEKLAYHDFQFKVTFKDAKLPMPSNWSEFVENSQRYQADLLKYAIEHYRREKYSKIGAFFQFQFVDCWPSITWSVVSYARRPKPSYYAMQRAFQPVLIGTELDRKVWSKGRDAQRLAEVGLDIALRPWVVNDEHHPLEGTSYEVVLRRNGTDVPLARGDVKEVIPADGVAQLPELYSTLPGDVAPGRYDLVLTLKQGDKTLSQNTYPVTIID